MTTSRAVPPIPAIDRARVLLAEDDAALRALLAAGLRSDGHDVVEASDGGRLLVVVGKTYLDRQPHDAFDVIVTDMRMPVSNGLAILEQLRAAGWTTPAIVMTAFGDEGTRVRVAAMGGVLFSKPFDVDDLRTAVLHVLRGRRATRRGR